MHAFELKLPPPVVALITATLMWVVSSATPALNFSFPASTALAAILVLIGLGIDAAALISFRIARTTVNPMRPGHTSALVTSGIYCTTRNPMYLGMLLVLAGWSVTLSNPLAIVLLPVFVLYLNRFQIGPEEHILSGLFGKAYADYQARVRRWI
ncbi:MAG: isoprenylcysteine carboxylmethyltransferase family protein [Pseudomonadota bacterium]